MEFALSRLRHIAAVARNRSFSRAAEELCITQPALSRSIGSFERRYGIRLFDRGAGGVTLTPVGSMVLDEAERLLRSASDFEHNLNLYGKGEAGSVSIGIGPLAASLILPGLGRSILNENASLQLHTSIKLAEQLLQELLSDQIEMIIANSWTLNNSSELEVTPIGSLTLGMIVRNGHPLAARTTVLMDELRSFPAINPIKMPAGGMTGEAGAFSCDNYHIMREAALGSNGVWLASPELFKEDIDAGRLRLLNVADFVPLANVISLIRRKQRTMSPAARSIADIVRMICAP